jgi:hypothetical protein
MGAHHAVQRRTQKPLEPKAVGLIFQQRVVMEFLSDTLLGLSCFLGLACLFVWADRALP